jgi:hypothetical protein
MRSSLLAGVAFCGMCVLAIAPARAQSPVASQCWIGVSGAQMMVAAMRVTERYKCGDVGFKCMAQSNMANRMTTWNFYDSPVTVGTVVQGGGHYNVRQCFLTD